MPPLPSAPLDAGDETIDIAQAPVAEGGELMHRHLPSHDLHSEPGALDRASRSGSAVCGQRPAPPEQPRAGDSTALAPAAEETERIPAPAQDVAAPASPLQTTHDAVSDEKPAGNPLVPEPKLITEKPANPKRGWWQRLIE